MSTDKQSAGRYMGGPNRTQDRESPTPSQEGYKNKQRPVSLKIEQGRGGGRRGYEHRGLGGASIFTLIQFVLKII